jgi:hypothetical protein
MRRRPQFAGHERGHSVDSPLRDPSQLRRWLAQCFLHPSHNRIGVATLRGGNAGCISAPRCEDRNI